MENKQSAGPQQGCFPFITELHPCLPTGALHRLSFRNADCWFVPVIPLCRRVLLHCLRKTTQVWLGPQGILNSGAPWPCCSVQSSSKCCLLPRGSLWGIVSARGTTSSYFLFVSRGWHSLYCFWKEQICMSRCFTNKKVCLYLRGL